MRTYPTLTNPDSTTYWIKQAHNGKGYRIFTEEHLVRKIEDGTIKAEDQIQLARIVYNNATK